jgi:hypothetical protein
MLLSNKIIDDVQRKIRRTVNVVHHSASPYLIISVSHQYLYIVKDHVVLTRYRISTALKGIGNKSGSGQTPLGVHRIAEKIGANAPLGCIFKARCDTGQIACILTVKDEYSGEGDNITSRILWLDGVEQGKNKGGDVDTHSRYIYIHGTDEEWRLGEAVSHGCIRMANKDVIQLFNEIVVDSLVVIIK